MGTSGDTQKLDFSFPPFNDNFVPFYKLNPPKNDPMTSMCDTIKEAGILLHVHKENRQWKIKEGHAQEFADKSCLLLGSGAVKQTMIHEWKL